MKLIRVCALTTFLYFITFSLSARIFTLITHEPVDLARDISGPVIGLSLIILPYIFNGYYCRQAFSNPIKYAVISSLILVISERVLIYIIGYMLVASGGDGSMEGITVMKFIQGEAAPYYTITYIIMGVLSICISAFTASTRKSVVQ